MPEEEVSRSMQKRIAVQKGEKMPMFGVPPAADAGPRQPKPCGEPAASFIPRWGMYFTCVLPKGHEGEHRQGGTCFKHGEYVGEKCPKWPDCSAPVPQEAAPDITVTRTACHPWATAPDSAMRVAREVIKYVESTGDNGAIMDAQVAKVIREAGSDEITKLRADYDREHKWLNDAASEANCDLDSVASAIRKLREAGSERERELASALRNFGGHKLGCAIPPYGRGNKFFDKECSCGFREASRLLGGDRK